MDFGEGAVTMTPLDASWDLCGWAAGNRWPYRDRRMPGALDFWLERFNQFVTLDPGRHTFDLREETARRAFVFLAVCSRSESSFA